MTMQEYEETLKAAMALARSAREASQAVLSLDEKLRYQRLSRELDGVVKTLRLQYYEIHDMLQVPVKKCQECGQVTI